MHNNCNCSACQAVKNDSELEQEVYQHIISCGKCCGVAVAKQKEGLNFYQIGPYLCTVGQMLVIELENQDKATGKIK